MSESRCKRILTLVPGGWSATALRSAGHTRWTDHRDRCMSVRIAHRKFQGTRNTPVDSPEGSATTWLTDTRSHRLLFRLLPQSMVLLGRRTDLTVLANWVMSCGGALSLASSGASMDVVVWMRISCPMVQTGRPGLGRDTRAYLAVPSPVPAATSSATLRASVFRTGSGARQMRSYVRS